MENSGFLFTTVYGDSIKQCMLYASPYGDTREAYHKISETERPGSGIVYFRLSGFESTTTYSIRVIAQDKNGNITDLFTNYDGSTVPVTSVYIYGNIISSPNAKFSAAGEDLSSIGSLPAIKLDFKNGYVYFKRWTNRRYAERYATIQDAYNDLPTSGGTVVLASESYSISNTIAMNKEYTALVGDGITSSIIKATVVGQTAITMSADHLHLENFKIDGVSGEMFDKGIFFNRSSYSVLSNLYIDKTKYEAIRFDYDSGTNTFSKENFVDTVYCINNGNDGATPAIMLNVCDNNYFNNIYVISCQAASHGAVRLIQSDGVVFVNSHISGSSGIGLEIGSDTYNLQFLGGSIGGSVKHGIYISSGRSIYIGAGTRIHENGQGAANTYYNILVEPPSGDYVEDLVIDAFVFGPKEPQNGNDDATCKVKNNIYVHGTGNSRVVIKGKVFKSYADGITIAGGSDHKISADVFDNAGNGVNVASGTYVEVTGNILNNGNNGLMIDDTDTKVSANIKDNTGDGIYAGADSDRLMAHDSIITNNSGYDINLGDADLSAKFYVHDSQFGTISDPNNLMVAHDNI